MRNMGSPTRSRGCSALNSGDIAWRGLPPTLFYSIQSDLAAHAAVAVALPYPHSYIHVVVFCCLLDVFAESW